MKAGSTMTILPRDAFRMSLGHEARSLDKELVAFRARARLMPHSLSQIRALKGLTGPRQSITFPWKLGSKALKRGPQKSFNSESSCCMRAWKFQPSSMTKMSGLSSGNLHQIRRNLEPQMQSPAVLKPRGSLSLTRVSRCPKLKKSRALKSLFQEILSKAWQPKNEATYPQASSSGCGQQRSPCRSSLEEKKAGFVSQSLARGRQGSTHVFCF